MKNSKVMMRLVSMMSAVALVASLGLAGCSSAASSSSADSSASSAAVEDLSIPVTVTVSSPGADEQVTYEGTVNVAEGASVLDVLHATGLEVDEQKSEYGMFVNAVDGLANEGMKGWTYTVNGEQVQTSADKTIVNGDDAVEWSYIDMSA